MTLVSIVIGWLIGLVVGDAFHVSPVLGIGLALSGGLAAVVGRTTAPIWLVATVVIGIGFGVVRMAWAQPTIGPQHILHLRDQSVRLEGIVVDEPRWTPDNQRLILSVEQVGKDKRVVPAQGLVLIELPPEPAYYVGERLVVAGILIAPPSGRGFDYAAYLRRRGIFVTLKKPVVALTLKAPPSLQTQLQRFKDHTRRLILRTLPEPEASLLVGILLGIQSSIPQDVWETFNRTGTSHILVISGWNISIIVATLLAIGKRLAWRRVWATIIAIGVIVLYVLLVGATPSVVRAAVMGVVIASANPLGRRADAWTALAAACLLMTAYNPQVLWDVGFQLSALATAGLFAWGGWAEQGVRWLIRPTWLGWMIEPLTATFAAQVWALPIILYQFGNLSLVAPFANVLMVPVVPLAMGAGAALAGMGLLWRPLTIVVVPLVWCALAWLIVVAGMLAGTAWAAVSLPPIAAGWILGWYILTLIGWAWLAHDMRPAATMCADVSADYAARRVLPPG